MKVDQSSCRLHVSFACIYGKSWHRFKVY